MGGIILLSLLLGLILCLVLLVQQHRFIQRLTAQTEAFLENGGEILPISLQDSKAASLQNAISRLENRLLLSQEQTRQEAQRSSQLLSDISHQLKTPLASLRLFVELDNGPHLAEQTMQLDRMQLLISSLLRLERLCADGYSFSFHQHSLRELILGCWLNLESLYPRKCFTLEGDASLSCDETWMGEAVTNLLKNACEHTEDCGRIEVFIEDNAREVHLVFRDHGDGVDAEALPRIFDRFYQVKGRPSTGAGIGLSIVKEIVKRHHGTISAQNTPDGLEFHLFFPKLERLLTKS